jgi:hypothetical protein
MAASARKRSVRAVAGVVAVVCLLALAGSALAGPTLAVDTAGAAEPSTPTEHRSAPVGTLTVVATQGFYTGTRPGDRDVADLFAFDRDGTVVYHDQSYQVYFDVDPVPGTGYTVEYVAAERLGPSACPAQQCSRNVVERVNLTTGAVTRVYDAVTPQFESGRWHDVDRVNETHLVVADIVRDRVYLVDVRTAEIAWQWNASDHYPPTAGGGSGDWTHLNDVEILTDGRLMASLRNMDEVVFIEPGSGVVDTWTLGADDDHAVLFEQHNPDYLPSERGGPAVLVADSENNRVVEYHRRDGTWVRAWSWRDSTLQWPRDADRLPNGHTLVVDSHGNRVVEVATDGTVAWSVDVGRPYDAERLGTGDESAGGYAAGAGSSGDRTDTAIVAPPATDQGTSDGAVVVAIKAVLPSVVVNGLLFVAPPWFGFTDLLMTGILALDLLLWGGIEWRWSDRSFRGGVRRLPWRN